MWLEGWKYRRAITIHSAFGAWVDYQVRIKIGEGPTVPQCDFCLNWHSNKFPTKPGDGGDLRFTLRDGSTLLDFWVEQVESSSEDVNRIAYVWVKVHSNLNQDQVIYCYYGNPESTNYSDGRKTFLWFDNFSRYDEYRYHTDISLKGMNTIEPTWDSGCDRLQIDTGQNNETSIAPRTSLSVQLDPPRYFQPYQSFSARVWFCFNHGYPYGAEAMLSVRYNEYGYYIASLLGSYVDPETGEVHENTNPSPTIRKSDGTILATASTNSYLQSEQTLDFGLHDTNLYFFVNNELVVSASDSSFLSPGVVVFSCADCVGAIHQILVRKFTYPEPYIQDVGEEEVTEKGWLIDWKYRRKITLEKEDYVYLFKIGESPNELYTDFNIVTDNFPSAANDPGDVRFTLSDGVTKLPIWVEKVSGVSPYRVAYIWVRCPQTRIYCYYNHPNPPVDYVNDPIDAFEFYETFDENPNKSGKWRVSRHSDDTASEFVWSETERCVALTTSSYTKGSVALAVLKRRLSNFCVKFQFKVDGGADGMTIVADLVSYISGRCPVGGTLGIYGIGLIGSAVEFDEFHNQGEPLAPHIAVAERIQYSSNQTNPDAWAQINFNDGEWHECEVRYGGGGYIQVYLDNRLIFNLGEFTLTNGKYFAFSGTTGGSKAAHYIKNISIRPYIKPEPKIIDVSPPEVGKVEGDYETFYEVGSFSLWESIDLSQKITYSYKTSVKKCLSGETARAPMMAQPTLSTTITAFGSEDTSYQIEQKARSALNKDIIIPHFVWRTKITTYADPNDEYLIVSDPTVFEEGGLAIVVRRNQYVRVYVVDQIYQQKLFLRTKLGVSFDTGDYVYPAFLGFVSDVHPESRVKHKVVVVTMKATEKFLNDIKREGTATLIKFPQEPACPILSCDLRPKTVDVYGSYVDPRSVIWNQGLVSISSPQNVHGIRGVNLKFTFTQSWQWQLLRDTFFYTKGRYLPIKVSTWRGECSIRYKTRGGSNLLRLLPRSYADEWESHPYLCVDFGKVAQPVRVHACWVEGNHCFVTLKAVYLKKEPWYGMPVHYLIDAYFASDELTLDFKGEICEASVNFIEKF